MNGVFAAVLLVFTAAIAKAVELRVASFNIGARLDLEGDALFLHGIGPKGSPDHDAVADVLARIDADVVALQEIHSADLSQDLGELAAGLGYPHVHVANTTRAFDTALRVVVMSRHPFLSQISVSAAPGTREITRNHAAVVVDVPGTNRNPLIVTSHLKAGTGLSDRFRRAVEMRRLVDFLDGPANSGIENWVIVGDFNLSSNSTVFHDLPSGLPNTFNLGADIPFPLNYHTNPIAYFNTRVPFLLEPRQLDGSTSTYNTWQSGGPTIDLIMISPALGRRPVLPEIYNSNLDVPNHSGLPKSGPPLPAATSYLASDHYVVFVDLELDPAATYTFTASGETVGEDFTGFLGVADPERWTTSGGSWLGRDGGGSPAPGFRSYGTIHDGALGFLAGDEPGVAVASFANQSPHPLTALKISLSAEVRRAVAGGTDDGFTVDLLPGGAVVPLPDLTFTAGSHGELDTLVAGLDIPPGGTFELRFTFGRGGAAALPADIFINEFHYDNAGADVGEFIEVVAGPGFTGNLSDVSLVLYNGGNGETYGTALPLSQFTAGAVTDSGHRFYSAEMVLQNGAPDGFALVSGNDVIEFLSYEGAFGARNGPAAGMTSVDIGVSQVTLEPADFGALGLTGAGSVAGEFTWTKFSGLPHSPGQPNDGQTFTNLPPGQGISLNRLEVTFPAGDPDSDGDGISDADEAIFGTDPFNATSRYTVAFTNPNEETARLTFGTVAGRSYVVQTSADLVKWEDQQAISGDGLERAMDFPADPETGRRFFRVRVALE